MDRFLRNTILGLAMMISSLAFSNNPGIEGLDNINEVVPELKESIQRINKVNTKEVEKMFMKKKRIDKIFTPKKRLSKKKYFIA
ncbi:hypothetical protein ACXGQW_02750 [Wenyingzhuangia sp. IMCC45533]